MDSDNSGDVDFLEFVENLLGFKPNDADYLAKAAAVAAADGVGGILDLGGVPNTKSNGDGDYRHADLPYVRSNPSRTNTKTRTKTKTKTNCRSGPQSTITLKQLLSNFIPINNKHMDNQIGVLRSIGLHTVNDLRGTDEQFFLILRTLNERGVDPIVCKALMYHRQQKHLNRRAHSASRRGAYRYADELC